VTPNATEDAKNINILDKESDPDIKTEKLETSSSLLQVDSIKSAVQDEEDL